MFRMAVSEREVATLAVPVGRQVPPDFRHAKNLVPPRRRNAKERIENPRFVHVEKYEQLGGRRVVDVRFLLEAGRKNIRLGSNYQPVDRLTHVIAPRAGYGESNAIGRFDARVVGRTMIEGYCTD